MLKAAVFLVILLKCVVNSTYTLPKIKSVEATERGTDFLRINWTLTDPNSTVDGYKIHVTKEGDEGSTTFTSNVYKIEQEAKIDVNEASKSYNVCLIAIVKEDLVSSLSTVDISSCNVFETIPLILDSSIIALVAVVGGFLLLILIGIVVWKCKQVRSSSHRYEPAETNGNGVTVQLTRDTCSIEA